MTLNPTLGAALVASALLAACGASPSGSGDAAAPMDVADGSTPLLGSFVIQLVAATATAPAYTQIFGRVQQGETPEATLWDLALADGESAVAEPHGAATGEELDAGGNGIELRLGRIALPLEIVDRVEV